ncbi:hypothetical protein CPB84DRAFT_832311 [Gymnopilus junonius]|uniref:Uncharacterized protein n=1 Tax=Gymnopilus junonius TaxID=109634 RepID=A0A9P5NQB2_GYMJU|nr:hypothetical protein CPB84DRAFT_832311 [Gymnopilus junonius]
MSSNIFHEELSSMHHDVLQETPNKHPLFASEDAQILWVYGQTASERRSVAQTVVDACRTSGRLGASFFFEGGCKDVKRPIYSPALQINLRQIYQTWKYQRTVQHAITQFFP